MNPPLYYLPGHGGRIHTGLGEALLGRGYSLMGRETVGDFLQLPFQAQIEAIAEDLTSQHWDKEARVIGNSFGAYLFLHAQTLMPAYIGKVLLLSPIVGHFTDTENTKIGFYPPRASRLLQIAATGDYPTPRQTEIHVGELDWQSNPTNVTRLGGHLGLPVTIVPGAGHMLGKAYVSCVLDQWLA